MIVRRIFTLTALVVAASLSLSDRANAGYDYSTSVSSVTDTGGGGTTPIPAGSTISIGGTNVPVTFGGTKFVDAGGSTIFLLDSFTSNFPTGTPAGPVENIFISTPGGVSDSSTWSFQETIKITNPSASLGGSATGNLVVTAQYVMQVTGGAGSAILTPGSATSVGPTSVTVGGNSFFLTNVGASSTVQVNNSSTNAALGANINTIPEPASVVMLGGGLIGVMALGLRRRRRSTVN